jgi:hypothetical protein
VKSPIVTPYYPGHSSLIPELGGLLVESSFAALKGSEHSNCYFMRNWDGCATLHCRCWSMDCSLENNYYVPHSFLAPYL